MGKRAIGIFNGNSKYNRSRRFESEGDFLTSPNDDVLAALKKLMGEPAYTEFFAEVYSAWRWKDYEKYSQILRDKLSELKSERAERDRGDLHVIDTQDLSGTVSFEHVRRENDRRFKKCTDCDGSGRIFEPADNSPDMTVRDCPTCKRTGRVPREAGDDQEG